MIYVLQSWPVLVLMFFVVAVFFLSFWGAVRFALVGGTVGCLTWFVGMLATLLVIDVLAAELPSAMPEVLPWIVVFAIAITAGALCGRGVWERNRRRSPHVDKSA